MSYGMQTFSPAGALEFSSTSIGGVFVNEYTIPTTGGTSSSPAYIAFPQYPGRQIAVVTIFAGDQEYVADYALGYPRIAFWQANPAAPVEYRNTSRVMVFLL